MKFPPFTREPGSGRRRVDARRWWNEVLRGACDDRRIATWCRRCLMHARGQGGTFNPGRHNL